MSIWKLLDKIKGFIVYDADKEFYAKVFPDSVGRIDLMHLRKMRVDDLPSVLEIEASNLLPSPCGSI